MTRKAQSKVGENKSDIVRAIPLACTDESAAVVFMETRRWGDCPCCPRCGDTNVYQMKNASTGERNARFLWRCRGCKKQFTVRIGTVFEESRIPLRFWCFAFWAACSSKKGISALQIQRQTGLSYKSALFMMHRIRWAMHDEPGSPPKLTGEVEADETYVGGRPRGRAWHHGDPIKPRAKYTDKKPVIAMVERGGNVRTRVVDRVTPATLKSAVNDNVSREARLLTDDLRAYRSIGAEYRDHQSVNHTAGEYVRLSDRTVHTQTIEGFFSLLKRGLHGTFHSVSKKHLHRYVDEFAFKWNTRDVDDGERMERAIRGAVGKRLLYRVPTQS